MVLPSLHLVGQKIAAHPGHFPEKFVVEAIRRAVAINHFGLGTGPRQIETRAVGSRQSFKCRILPLPILEVAGRNRIAAALYLRPRDNQLARIAVWHGLDQRGIDDAEDRRSPANAESQRERRNQSEAVVLPPQPKSKADVTP